MSDSCSNCGEFIYGIGKPVCSECYYFLNKSFNELKEKNTQLKKQLEQVQWWVNCPVGLAVDRLIKIKEILEGEK